MLRKKLIEVALPLDAINQACAKESPRLGHPSTLHLWWARRPLAAARAVIFAQMVDDPSAWPELFPTGEAQEQERQRLFRLIEELVLWKNTANEDLLERAREEIRASWRRTCAENTDHTRAIELFDPERLPAFHDPFAGGGSLPLEAQRLGLDTHASDLNPVAALINKAMIEIPPKFAGMPPVNPESQAQMAKDRDKGMEREWKGAQGLAEDVRYYGKWMRDEAEKRIGHLYPKVEVTAEMAKDRPDLKHYVGRELTVIAWLWARTVKSPNPAFRDVDVPLATTFVLSTRKGREAYVEPTIVGNQYYFTVKTGRPSNAARSGTSAGRRRAFLCLMSGTPVTYDYIRSEGVAGRMRERMLGIVVGGDDGRVYVSPTSPHEDIAGAADPMWKPEGPLPARLTGGSCVSYGMTAWGDLFTRRQLVALTTLSDLAIETSGVVERDAGAALTNTPPEYAQSMAVYLGLSVSRQANRSSNLNFWDPSGAKIQQVFARQALPMVWDFVESNPFCSSSGNFVGQVRYLSKAVDFLPFSPQIGTAAQRDAQEGSSISDAVYSTDPPYFDNISYAHLSDFFYVWLRRSLRKTLPRMFDTLAVPKAEELVATIHRHGSKAAADAFFLNGMARAMRCLADQSHPSFPTTIYYAFKQAEQIGERDTASTGWETFLDAVIRSGFTISGTWPVRTELTANLKKQVNALASSIVLVCRKRPEDAPLATRRQFVDTLKSELPNALAHLQSGHIAPVDLAQAAIGPGMAVYTRYAKVVDAAGNAVTVREALALINETLDEVLSAQEGDFDADTRWALAWFEQHGFEDGEYGVAETLSKAKNTTVRSLQSIGVLQSRGGKVRLSIPLHLRDDWDPRTAGRMSAWLTLHHLIRVHDAGGEQAAAALVRKLGSVAETAREIAYRLYAVAERTKRSREALWYNALVQSWPEIARLAADSGGEQAEIFAADGRG